MWISLKLTSNRDIVLSYSFLAFGFPPWRPGFDFRSDYVGFVVDEVELEHAFSEYFGFSCKFSLHLLLYTHYYPGLVQ
jgi:hypothetical protein